MLTIEDIIATKKAVKRKPDDEELRRLPDRLAEIHARLSKFTQVRNSRESVNEIAYLVSVAKQDGYKTGLEPEAVEHWLADIQAGVAAPGILKDGELIVNCLGLGVSGSRPEDKRPDLTSTIELLEQGKLGAIYVTEGPNRLSRDPDRVVSSKLLKLMKDTNCKLRTPEELLSPCIERDWDIIHEGLEEGAEELKARRVRLYRRKARKAAKGEFVGEPIPAGFILPILGQKVNGKYEFGKIRPYVRHAEVVIVILRQYVKQQGSELKTVRALGDLVFPGFEEEYRYMEGYSALRCCPKKTDGDRIIGYQITPELVHGLATNPKLIGVWEWCDVIIPDNHEPAVPVDLFLAAYELAIAPGKQKGRSINYEPLEWAGLLWCYNHEEPELISNHACQGEYRCVRDYHKVRGPICLDVSHRFIDEPLTTEVLRRLDFSPYAEEALANLEAEAMQGKLEEAQRRRDEAALEHTIKKWKALLPCCVDLDTGRVDREKEEYYWAQIREAEACLEALKTRPMPSRAITALNVQIARQFLAELPHAWGTYPRALRNRLLKLLIERVELRHTRERIIEATAIWKAGFEQRVTIHLPRARASREKHWTEEEDRLLRMLWPSASKEVLGAALSNRTWQSICCHASYLGLRREKKSLPHGWRYRAWMADEEAKAKDCYESGVPLSDIVAELGHSRDAVLKRAMEKRWCRPPWVKWKKEEVRWEAHELIMSQGECSTGHHEV